MTGGAARAAVLCWVAGGVVAAVTWWDSGEQGSSATQLPAFLVAFGMGIGLFVVGAALWSLDRARARARTQSVLLARVVALAEERP